MQTQNIKFIHSGLLEGVLERFEGRGQVLSFWVQREELGSSFLTVFNYREQNEVGKKKSGLDSGAIVEGK